ncbi:hypothetical protein GPECTOR_17g849 [Gonium pectorale]|uniref:Uncharacterized protein n=1 Tax=Gonium pectorale TaxID=33097 RepID=A0A150GK94_GONPE|nr:hypothetical protein GPECTOR_17g849 [Gonium pectorale]|eukprot:KXZ50212.1 hypothetical protein GPECTOR_17g849 [Gonium pectorale]
MTKEHSGPSLLRFQTAQSLDVSSVVPGVSGYLAVYDVQTNTRLGRVDLKSVPVEMAFAPDGSVIIVVVQDWIVYSVSTSSWKARVLVPRRAKMDKPLERCLLAVAPGHNPFIYFCRYAKDTLRLATLPSRAGGVAADGGAGADAHAAAGGGGRGRGGGASGNWGSRVKLDVQKPILALACHVVDAQVLVLTGDGSLRGYAIAGGGGDVLSPLYSVPVVEGADKGWQAPGLLACVPHPSVPGGALVLQGSASLPSPQGPSGAAVAVLEAPGRGPPTPLLRTRMPGWATTVGLGVDPATNTLLAFGLSEGGRLRSGAWRLSYRQGAVGVALRASRVEPQDLTPLLDSVRRTKGALANGMAVGAAAAAAFVTPGAAAEPLAPTAAALARSATLGGAGGYGVGPASAPTWAGLWSVSPAWSHDVSGSCLLESQLGPHVRRVLVHPGLGLLAVAAEPSAAASLKRELLFTGRGELATEEAALARRTAHVALLHVANLEAHAGGWRGVRAAPQHTGLAAWMPPQLAAAAAAAAAAAPAVADDSSDDEAPPPPPAPSVGEAGAAADGSLTLPPHVYYLAGNRLMKYSLITRTAGTIVQLPTDAPDGDTRQPRQLLHSARRGAWLVFFESAAGAPTAAAGGNGMNGTAGGAASGPERFTWALVNAGTFGAATDGGAGGGAVAGLVTWVRAGKCGCFLGPDDAHFAIASANGRLLEVFDTSAGAAAPGAGGPTVGRAPAPAPPPQPLLTLTLEGGVLLPPAGLGAPIFPGPPMTNAPLTEARAPPEAPPHDWRRFRGSGVVLWQSPDGCLSATTLPALVRVPLEAPPPAAAVPTAAAARAAAADSSDDDSDAGGGGGAATEPEQPYYATLPSGHHFGTFPRQGTLPLLPGENVIHVAWQSLIVGGAAAATDGPADAVAAVLTSSRLLLVTAGLRVVCAASLATHGSAAVPEPLTSVMWAGPMLLASTATGQLMQLTWTGSLLPVATVSPTGHGALVGVTADSLLLLRTPLGAPPAAAAAAAASGNPAAAAALAEVVARPAALLQPLMIGWATLAATGLLSHGRTANLVRPALRHVLASYDAYGFTPRGVWALIAAGAWDVAAAVAAHMPPLDSSVKLAAAAAAGGWSTVAAALTGEATRALHAPAPPPRGSELHSKLVAAAAGALSHGQLTVAGELFQAAGEWAAAMILAVCSGQVQNVSAVATRLASGGIGGAPLAPAADAAAAGQLASALRSVYGSVGSPVGDLTLSLSLSGSEAEPLERADRWPLAASMAAPAAIAVQGALPRSTVSDAELGAIPPAAAAGSSALAYYGLTATAAGAVAAAAAAAGARVAAADRGAGAASLSGADSSHRPGGSLAGNDLETASVASSDAAQLAARAEFLNHAGAGLYTGGVAAMQSGDWRTAAAHFSRGMSVLQHEERTGPGALEEGARRARLGFCAAYYTAVRLLEGVGSGAGRREARLYRYLAGLRLDPTHATALLREAITRNKAIGNYRYAGDQLTALIGRVADTAPGEYLAQLQAEIEECDRHGGSNADVPGDEQVEDWAALVVAAGEGGGGKADVDALVLPLLA